MSGPVIGIDPAQLAITSIAEEANGVVIKVTMSEPRSTITQFNVTAEFWNAAGVLGPAHYGSGGFGIGETTTYLAYDFRDDAQTGNRSFKLSITPHPFLMVSAPVDPARSSYNAVIIDNDGSGYTSTAMPPDVYAGITRTPMPGNLVLEVNSHFAIQNLGSVPHYPTTREGVAKFSGYAISTTAVAVTTYQFFTGSTPSAAGLDYLVSSTANPNDLNDPYYQAFSLENRYINFAVNLGLVGDGKDAFAATFKPLTFAQTVERVYDIVIGASAATAAGFNPTAAIADIAGREAYFTAVSLERMPTFDQDLAKKAGLAGYILAEAVKANVGVYARALENLYIDLTDGSAKLGVDLIGAYGPGTPIDLVI